MADAEASLRVRVLSALIMAPVVLAAVVMGGVAFALLMALVLVLMAREWRRLTRARFGGADGSWAAALALVVSLLVLLLSALERPLAALALLAAGAAAAAAIARIRDAQALWPVLGVLYLGLPALALVWLRNLPDVGGELLVWLLLVVVASDSAAFFAGRGLGGPRLAPHVSPKKTWSGLLGGIVGGGVVGVAVAALVGFERVVQAGLLGAVLALVSQAGDLAESALKRAAGVKDSGSLIPGHGGVLDRVDGLLFAAPALALLVLLLGPGGWR